MRDREWEPDDKGGIQLYRARYHGQAQRLKSEGQFSTVLRRRAISSQIQSLKAQASSRHSVPISDSISSRTLFHLVGMWRQPNLIDDEMMQEVLQLLATDSQPSTTASSNEDNFSSMDGNLNANASHDCDGGRPGNETLGSVGALPMGLISLASDEEEQAVVPGAGQTERQDLKEEGDEALGVAQQMQNPISDLFPQLSQSVATSQLMLSMRQPAIHPLRPPQSLYPAAQQCFAGDPELIASAATEDSPTGSFQTSALPTSGIPPCYPPASAQSSETAEQCQIVEAFPVPPVQSLIERISSQPTGGLPSNVLPTGQRVHVMNSMEFEELRRKLRMQTASRRYRKRKKENNKQQKAQIQAFQAELARLQQLEAQSKQYEQRSVESLQEELKLHKADVAELSVKLEEAAKEELHWINMMKSHLRK